ncbi:hypothetical protein JW930_03565 [Candidatus Woesearchaeota archaeon]|nr:hypothetical protein [Candidatus Woesearchaeota archaeon]
MEKVSIGISTTSMGNGHLMKAFAVAGALEEIKERISDLIDIEYKVLDEKDYFHPFMRYNKRFVETVNNLISNYVPSIYKRMTLKSNINLIRFSEDLFRKINFMSRPLKLYDIIISTYPPLERIAKIDKNTKIIRLLPDIFGHSFYFIDTSSKSIYVVPDSGLRSRILSGGEPYLDKSLIPRKEDIFTAGIFASRENYHSIINNKLKEMLKKKKLNIMLQLGGAGAQQDIYISTLAKINLEKISPLYVAHSNRKFFNRLLKEGYRLGLMSKKEISPAIKEQKGLYKFNSGISILYHKNRKLAVQLLEREKSNNILNVVKPGDVTSGSIPHLLLPPIGTQEIENGNWAVEKGFAKWITNKKLSEKELGELAAETINRITTSEIEEMHLNLKKLDHSGAYKTAARAIVMTTPNRNVKNRLSSFLSLS